MQIKKLMVKRFGELVDREYDGGKPVVTFTARNAEEQQVLCEVIMAVLFGFPPHRRARCERYISRVKGGEYSASLVIETEDGEYLIGRNFNDESLEIFQCQARRLLSLPATALMDLLYREVGTLNPLDFEVISLFEPDQLLLNQHAPLVREHVQQLISTGACQRIVPPAFSTTNSSQIKLEIEKIDRLQQRITDLQKESNELVQEEEQYAAYEKFLSSGQGDLLEELAQEYTAASLERSFYEEQVREKQEARKIIEWEAQRLREKIAAFDLSLYTPEVEERVLKLLKIKEQRMTYLQKEEVELSRLESMGLFSRLRQKELIEERKQRIEKLLQDLALIREELRVLLKGKRPEDYLAEKAQLEQYYQDLSKLERPTPRSKGDEQTLERLAMAKKREEHLRQQLEQLFNLAGREELESVKTKVKALRELKQKKRIVDTELTALLTGLGQEQPEAALAYLDQKRKTLEVELATAVEEPNTWGDDPLAVLYQDASNMLGVLTAGQYRFLTPHLKGDQLGFIVSGAGGEAPSHQLEPGTAGLVVLAFRLALSRQRQAKEKAFLILSILEQLPADRKIGLLSLLQEWFPSGQIILIENRAG